MYIRAHDDTNILLEGVKRLRIDPVDYFLDMVAYWYQSMTWDQWALMFLSGLAITLVTDKRPKVQRWGFVVGLTSQPFWLYSSWVDMAGGIFVMSLYYTMMWSRGTMHGFFPKTQDPYDLWLLHPDHPDGIIYVEKAYPHRWSWPDSPHGPRPGQNPLPVEPRDSKVSSFFDEPEPIRHYDDPRREP